MGTLVVAANKYAGRCTSCGVLVGEWAGRLTGGPGWWRTWCLACYQGRDTAQHPALWRLSSSRIKGRLDEVLHREELVSGACEAPEWLALVSSERVSLYNEEEDRSGWAWVWVLREARAEEGAQQREEKRQEEEKKAREKQARDTWEQLRALLRGVKGETPEKASPPPSTEKYKGSWWGSEDRVALTDGEVWYLVYNGRDGDAWGLNNAGPYVATRYPLTPELRASALAAIEAQLAAK